MIQSLELSPYLTTTSTTMWICRTSWICTSTTRRGATPVLHGECHVPRGGRTAATTWICGGGLHVIRRKYYTTAVGVTTTTTRRLQRRLCYRVRRREPGHQRADGSDADGSCNVPGRGRTTLTSTTATTRRLQEQRRHGATTTALLPAEAGYSGSNDDAHEHFDVLDDEDTT